MRRSRTATILLCCFFPLIVWSRHSVSAQEASQEPEKERGIELYRKGNFSEAAQALKEAVKKRQKDSDAWYYLGLSLRNAGKLKDARKVCEKTLRLRPNFAPGYAAIAYTCLLGNDTKGAVRNAEKSLANDPQNTESLCIVGQVRLRERAAGDALARAEEALKIKSDYSDALILKTRALVSMFAQAQIRVNREAEPRTKDDQLDDPAREEKKRARYSLLQQAAESLEAYLKLRLEKSEQAWWGEQLEAFRAYGTLGTRPDSDISWRLRPEILYREKAKYTDAAR